MLCFLLGLDKGQCSYEDIERAKSLVPPNFEKYIEGKFIHKEICKSFFYLDFVKEKIFMKFIVLVQF